MENQVSQSREINILPATRIEGHGKVKIILDEDGNVHRAFFYATEIRGFDHFLLGIKGCPIAIYYFPHLWGVLDGPCDCGCEGHRTSI